MRTKGKNVGIKREPPSTSIIINILIVFVFIIGCLINSYPANSEPIVTDNLNGTFTADWPLNNSDFYDLYNLTMENGECNLTIHSFWWNQTTQSEFETGSTIFNIDTTTSPGDLMLISTSPGPGANLIKNGEFITSANWSFDSSNDITSEWILGSEYGKLSHYSISNPRIFGRQNVSSGVSNGNNGGSSAIDLVDALLGFNDLKWWQVERDQYLEITGFDITGRTGNIVSVVLWGTHRVEGGQYDGGDGSSGNSSLQYEDESNTFINTSIIPLDNTGWDNQSHDITSAFSSWTWSDVQNLRVRFINPDDSGPDGYVEWDQIWLEVTTEIFDETAYINQTFEVLNTTGFNDTLYEDFLKNMGSNKVNFTLQPDSVVLDYAGSFVTGQTTLYANETGGNGTWIYSFFNENNYGISPELWVGGTDLTSITRSLLRFNISKIPNGAIISSAVLDLWVQQVNTDDVPVAVYKVTKEWDEGIQNSELATDGATWDNADTDPTIPWDKGGEYDPTPYNLSTVYLTESNVFHSFNITTLVQEWVDGEPNYGLLLNDTDESASRWLEFTSDNGAEGQRPELKIQWKLPNYEIYGNFTSQVFDAEKVMNSWGNINWNGETPPGGTIAIETRTSLDNITWGGWSGNYSQPGDAIISGPGRYIQYRAHLQTPSPAITPTLYDVTIIFERTNLTFDRVVEIAKNVSNAEMSIAINDTVIWSLDADTSSSWTPETVDISEWILKRGFYNISLRLRLIIETEFGVELSVGYDNFSVGGLGNESRGEYISIGFDAGTKANWEEISWSSTLDPGTRIIIQTRTSHDNSSWGPWSSAYTVSTGEAITSASNQYIQYRAILITTNSSNTPVLSDVNILYSYYSKNGTLYMKNDFVPAAVASWGQLYIDSILNLQTIVFWYSLNSGGSWSPVDPGGDMRSVDTSSGTIRFKAEFLTADTSVTPTLLGFSLIYYTNNPPQFISPGYTNEAGSFGGGWFNFSVMYLDSDDDYPAPLKITIRGAGDYNLTMNELDPSDFDMTDGKWFFLNLTLPKGLYQYRFVAYDGIIWNSTSFVGFIVNNNPPELRYPSVSPSTGKGETSFNFTVDYLDKDGDFPAWIGLTVTGPVSDNQSLLELDTSDTTYWDGKDYYLNLILGKGSYTYFFTVFDGEDWISTVPQTLNVANNPPELTMAQVTPTFGNITTSFNFTVNYIDLDDDMPNQVTMNLTGPSNPGPHIMMELDPSDTIYSDGKLYYFIISGLTKGYYTHHFAASDIDGDWGETGEFFLPQVSNLAPQILTSDVTNADEDLLYSIQYLHSDADGDNCVWVLDTNASWLTLDKNSGYLNGTPDNGDVGWFWVNVSVSDNDGGLDWSYFILTVANSPPQIISTSPIQWAYENQQYIFDFEGDDEGEGNSHWTYETNASWISIDPVTGVLSGIPQVADVGSIWVNVTLYDGNGDFDSLNFSITVNDTSAPIADAGADDTIDEDTTYIFDGSGSQDNSGQITNYTWYFGDGEVGYGPTPQHIYTNMGTYMVVLVVRDPSGNEGYDAMELTVNNPSPVADAGSDLAANEGETVFFDASGSSDTPSDAPNLVYLWDFDNDTQFDDGVGVQTSYIWMDEGIFQVNLKVVDDNGDFGIATINVTVTNLPPSVDLNGPYSGLEGEKIYFFATASDSGNDVLWIRWDWDNDGQNDTDWTTQPYTNHTWALFGTYTVRVQVWDGDDGFNEDTASVQVIRPNQPPMILGVGGRYVHFDYPYLLDLTPYVYDPDTPINDLIVTTDSPYIEVNGLILTLNYPEGMVGKTDVVIITVSDGKSQDNDTFTVSITDNYPPESTGSIPPVNFDEGETLEDAVDLDNYFTDKDNDPLSYHFIGNVHVRPVLNSSTGFVSFSADPNWYGIENIIVRAYDPNGAFTEQVVNVTVNSVNFEPTIEGIQDVYVRLNSPWELLVLNPIYVWDDENILDLNLYTNSSFVTLSPTREGVLVFYYFDSLIETEIVKISVNDGEFTASIDVTVHISSDNWPPYIKDYSYPSTVRFDEDTELLNHFNLNDYFADNVTDTLTFTQIVESSYVFVTINTEGLVSFSSSQNWFGITSVDFRAQDTSGAWASFSIEVIVDSVNDVPEIRQVITYLQINENETWIIDLDDYFFDVEDGTNLTFSCNMPEIIIDPVTHEARWERDEKTLLSGVVFTASDGEANISMDPIDISVIKPVVKPESVKEPEPFIWLWVFLAFILGVLGVFVYREIRYRFRVEEAFLVNNAGILMTHLSRGESKMALDVELISAMLTAVQEFVKDSFSKGETDSDVIVDKKKSLEKLEFGEFHLVLEQGKYSFLCTVISGYVNKRLRKRMRIVLEEFETEYGDILHDWDGVMETFEKAQSILAKVFKKGTKVEEMTTSIGRMREGDEGVTQITYGETEDDEQVLDYDDFMAEDESPSDENPPPSA
ncbi:MAG: DNRLRE domain-containing protein [Thermoplasmata archaeon]|nr:MAG: DNRLRE domain-containing protein [Thermoplasmata archaeon]